MLESRLQFRRLSQLPNIMIYFTPFLVPVIYIKMIELI